MLKRKGSLKDKLKTRADLDEGAGHIPNMRKSSSLALSKQAQKKFERNLRQTTSRSQRKETSTRPRPFALQTEKRGAVYEKQFKTKRMEELQMVQRMMCRYKAQEIPPWVRRLLAKAKNRDFRSEKTDRRPSRLKRSDSVPTKTKVSVIASDPTLGRSLDVDSQRPSKLRPPTPFKIFKDENVPLSENRMKVCNHSTQEPKKQLFSWTNNGSVPILPTAVGDGWEDETDENIQNPRKSQKAHLSNFTNIEAAKHSRFGRMRLGTTKNFGMRCTKPSSWHTSKKYQIRKTFSLPKRNQKIVPASEDASCINPANEQELVLFEAYQTTLDSKRFFESESRGRCACSGKLDLGNCMLQ